MARRGVSEDRRRAAAVQGGLRMIAEGQRPLYRVRFGQDDRWAVEGCPWLMGDATSRRDALAAAGSAVAAMLGVEPDRFDVESW